MKLFSFVLILLLVSIATPLWAQLYDTEVISAELYSDTIQRTGKLDYKRTLNLAFKSSGYLTVLNVDAGDKFTKGQLLASLDITELNEQKNSHYAQLMQAKREVKRISQLMKGKLATERDMDAATTQVEITRSAYQVSYYNVEKAQIYAPFSGVVLARNTDLGELQSPGQIALEIAKLDWVVKVAITGQEVSQVQLGQKVRVTLSHLGMLDGVISKIPAIANAGSHLFTIEVLLPNIKLAPGMVAGQFAGVSIVFDSEQLIYRLPIAALIAVDDEGKAIVMAQSAENSSFTRHSFEVFKLNNDFIYVNAASNTEALVVVTKGWQNYSVGEK